MPKKVMDRREDYLVYATLKSEKCVVRNVLTKVYLPVKKTDLLVLEFYPTKKQARILEHIPLFHLKAQLKSLNSDVTRIEAAEVFSGGVATAYWGPKVVEHNMSGEPRELTVTHIHTSGEYIPANVCAGSFWLTPCSLLNPAATIGTYYTGKVTVRTVWKIDFKLNNGVKLGFRKHYGTRKDTETEQIRFSELVAEYKFHAKIAKIKKLHETMAELENVLRLASFAAQNRCVCVGWDMTSGNKHLKHYRRSVTIPSVEERMRNNELLELIDFPKFLRAAYRRFSKSPFKESLARAIDYAIPRETATLEGSFMTLYSALEMLVLGFRGVLGLQFILPSNQWKKVRKDLKEYISSIPPYDTSASQFDMIIGKLPELNRIPFAMGFKKFCAAYKVSLEDLWPVHDDNTGASLSSIRNKLVHGVVFSRKDLGALIVANEHLRWSVQRMILAALGWDASKSRVSAKYLSHMNAYKVWDADRKLLLR